MKKVRTIQRYKCDFCKYRSTKQYVEVHEKRCFRNPNRYCDYCDNTGKVVIDDFTGEEDTCPYCERFNKKKLKAIEAREKKEKEAIEVPELEEVEELFFKVLETERKEK